MHRKHTLLILGTTLAFAAGSASADQNNGKPYDWPDFNSIVTRNDAHQESVCDNIAKNVEIPDLTCSIDHPSWDDFAKADHSLPLRERTNGVSPWNCGGAFTFFRNYGEGGHLPDSRADDGDMVIADMKKKLKSLACSVDNVKKPNYLTYDAAKKQLTVHITRAGMDNSFWVGAELQTPALKKVFVGLNKYWDNGHNM
jgi:hypothetical protein